jgi:hypothetical protein
MEICQWFGVLTARVLPVSQHAGEKRALLRGGRRGLGPFGKLSLRWTKMVKRN